MRTVLATLGLGFLGAALTGGVSAAATPLAAGLAGGVAGNLATDLFKHLDRKVCERFLDGWSGIDENHHVVAALRLAQIDALRALIAKFEGSLGKDDDRLGDEAGFGFAARVKSFLAEETRVAQARSFSVGSADIDGRMAVIALLPDTFDDALAARRDSSERGEAGSAIAQVRTIAETAVLDELRARCGDSSKRIPVLFEDLFFRKEGAAGWFDLFVRDAADKLTHPNSEFAAIWNAEQTALIKAYVEALNVRSTEMELRIERLRTGFDMGIGSLAKNLQNLTITADETLNLVRELHSLQKNGPLPTNSKKWNFIGIREIREICSEIEGRNNNSDTQNFYHNFVFLMLTIERDAPMKEAEWSDFFIACIRRSNFEMQHYLSSANLHANASQMKVLAKDNPNLTNCLSSLVAIEVLELPQFHWLGWRIVLGLFKMIKDHLNELSLRCIGTILVEEEFSTTNSLVSGLLKIVKMRFPKEFDVWFQDFSGETYRSFRLRAKEDERKFRI